jgi:ribonuclease VapC
LSKVVLDASALLAYFYDETGATVIERAVSEGAVVSALNWAEVLSKAFDKGEDVDAFADKIKQTQFSDFKIVPVTEADALQIAKLRAKTKSLGLSLGDRACLALGLRLGLTVLTADRIWKNLAIRVPITIIR